MIQTNTQQFKSLKRTLDVIGTDDMKPLDIAKLFEESSMEDAYEDDVEYGGIGLLKYKPEGQNVSLGQITEGGTKRYWARTFALGLGFSEESLDDNKYSGKVLKPAKRLRASADKTKEIDGFSVLNLSTSSTAIGGYDSLPLAYASHKIVSGGTESNLLTYMTPSQPALMAARVKAAGIKGPNGIKQGVKMTEIFCPVVQEDVWKQITSADRVVGSNFNDPNVTKGYGLKINGVIWMDDYSATQWGIKTDAENGFRWKNRKKTWTNSWVDSSATVLYYAVYYRADFGWSNWRCWLQGNT